MCRVSRVVCYVLCVGLCGMFVAGPVVHDGVCWWLLRVVSLLADLLFVGCCWLLLVCCLVCVGCCLLLVCRAVCCLLYNGR